MVMANYTKRAGFYLNSEEKAVLDRRVAEAGMNRSEYIRHMIRTSNLKPYPEGYLEKVKAKIRKKQNQYIHKSNTILNIWIQ